MSWLEPLPGCMKHCLIALYLSLIALYLSFQHIEAA